MTAKKLFVRHVQTGEIREVSEEQRAIQDKNYWVRVTGDIKATAPADVPTGTDAEPATKTTSKATTPAK